MARKRKTRVFISYSRHDEGVAKNIADLLIATNNAVFLDIHSIEPGELWESKIDEAIKDSEVFIVCWCCRSEKSEFVTKEINAALADRDKKMVAALLCSAALPVPLARRQWIDMRKQITHFCLDHGAGEIKGDLPPYDDLQDRVAKDFERQRRRRTIVKTARSVVLTYLFITGVFFVDKYLLPKPPGPQYALDFGLVEMVTLFLVVVLFGLAYRWLKRRNHTRRIEKVAAAAESYFKSLRPDKLHY